MARREALHLTCGSTFWRGAKKYQRVPASRVQSCLSDPLYGDLKSQGGPQSLEVHLRHSYAGYGLISASSLESWAHPSLKGLKGHGLSFVRDWKLAR